jgi:phosphoribosyl 1,2-cyclic phosphodiesterase
MRLCVLGSGSSGNSTYVECGSTGLLIDAGLSARETLRRLEAIGVSADRIRAICLTHEHSDHTTGLGVLRTRCGAEVYANRGTIDGLSARGLPEDVSWNVFTTGSPFEVGDFVLEPFSVPHDAYDPVGFVIRAGAIRVGIVTDMGMVTGLIRERLRHCQALVLESNHDEALVKEADRPWHLKQRILGRQGHLSNEHAAALIEEVAGPVLSVVYLAHLSSECNRPHLALRETQAALQRRGLGSIAVRVALPDQVSEVWQSE